MSVTLELMKVGAAATLFTLTQIALAILLARLADIPPPFPCARTHSVTLL